MQTTVLLFSAAISAVFLYAWKRAYDEEVQERARVKRQQQEEKERQQRESLKKWLEEYHKEQRRKQADLERRPSYDWTDFLSSNDS